jgi:hypothetical protein
MLHNASVCISDLNKTQDMIGRKKKERATKNGGSWSTYSWIWREFKTSGECTIRMEPLQPATTWNMQMSPKQYTLTHNAASCSSQSNLAAFQRIRRWHIWSFKSKKSRKFIKGMQKKRLDAQYNTCMTELTKNSKTRGKMLRCWHDNSQIARASS